MCGIIGYVGQAKKGAWGETFGLTRALFLAAQHRGEHATGFVALTEPRDRPSRQQVVTAKGPLAAAMFLNTDPNWRRLRDRRCSVVIGHVRHATHGSPFDNDNNHPHQCGSIHLVHNGVITNHREIADRHRLVLRTECDSECLALLVAASAAHPVDGIATCFRECNGSMAVAAFDEARQVVYVARNGGRPLWLARLVNDRRIFFASTDEIILRAMNFVLGKSALSRLDLLMPVAEGQVHMLRPDGSILAVRTRMGQADCIPV